MGKVQAQKRKERGKNAGSPMPSAVKTMAALAKVFRKLKSSDLIVAWLYLWLTHQLIKPRGGTYPPFANPVRLRCYEPCRAHAFRLYHDGPQSWVEFSMPYRHRGQLSYHWQPCPRSLNNLFLSVVRDMPYSDSGRSTTLLCSERAATLDRIIKGKQRTIRALEHVFERKDNLHRYPSQALATHPRFDNRTQSLCTPTVHHQSAPAYLYISTDRTRFALYQGLNDVIERLWQAAEEHANLGDFALIFSNHHGKKVAIESISFCPEFREMPYLTETSAQNTIQSYFQDPKTYQRTLIPCVWFKHPRSIPSKRIIDLFEHLDTHLQTIKPEQGAAVAHWRQYYNEVTCVVALQFIALTSGRPTHSILPLREHFHPNLTLLRDKGKLRQCYLSDPIVRILKRYLDFQSSVLAHLGITLDKCPNAMAFLITEQHTVTALCACDVRQYLKQQDIPIVAYQLRHHFAQFGLNSALPTALLDHLMGHSQFGEGLTDCAIFPAQQKRIATYLESLARSLAIKEFPV
ncbi:hypothetical protein ACPV52_17095 [Vibrio astriarenae]